VSTAKSTAASQFAEKLGPSTAEAKALTEKEGFIAALKTLRHPKSGFSANCSATAVTSHVSAHSAAVLRGLCAQAFDPF
jgi:hypothetical protein